MTLRQSVLKALYPILMKAGKMFGLKAAVLYNKDKALPISSFYELKATAIDGTAIDFSQFKDKNVLLVNTASGCGYTNQLTDLEKLNKCFENNLVIIGFPSNDFKEQEKLSDKKIASFCKLNFDVDFLLTKKTIVVKSSEQNEVFEWLSNKKKNGWNDKDPEWNFSKYLVSKKGVLTHYFGPGIEPLSNNITSNL